MNIIESSSLTKHFKVYQKEPGILGSLKSLFSRKYYQARAVDKISFSIKEGELVGFIGPNGAGKTTTLKMLSGLLYPTSGKVSVLGYFPFDRKPEFLKQIALVMGQKNQLWWDLPPMESFLLNKEIYQIPKDKFQKTLNSLISLLEVEDIVNVQVRKLSLGQRMKCELIAALLHSPRVLFLDEPTIGLDVVMQKKLREFIREYNKRFNSTIILTSHYMDDVKELCKRVIIINYGKIIYDGDLDKIVKKFSLNKLLSITFEKKVLLKDLERFGTIREYEPVRVKLSVPISETKHVAAKILSDFPVDDINIEEQEIEEIIREIFLRKSETTKERSSK